MNKGFQEQQYNQTHIQLRSSISQEGCNLLVDRVACVKNTKWKRSRMYLEIF